MAYLTAGQFKAYRDISSSDDDSLIEDLIDRAEQAIDSYTNRTFEGTNDDRTFDTHRDTDGGVLWVYREGDLASINTITNGDGTTVSSSDYVTEPRNAVNRGVPIIGIRLKIGSGESWEIDSNGYTEDAITVNGVWAYSATPPDDIVQATAMLVAHYYDSRDSVGGDVVLVPGVSVRIPKGMPATVRQILDQYAREF